MLHRIQNGETVHFVALRRNLLHVSLLVPLVLLTSGSSFAQDSSGAFASTDEYGIRSKFLRIDPPTYPLQDKKQKITGVAVAQLSITPDGQLGRTVILQAPSDSIANAVREALQKAVMRPSATKQANYTLIGKVTFYFVCVAGDFVAFNPKDAPLYEKLQRSH